MPHQDSRKANLRVSLFLFTLLFLLGLNLLIYPQPHLPQFSPPALITSAGQSAEVQLAAVIAKRAGVEATLVKMATPENLGENKTLILVLGASLKGLGAAGLDMNQEINRVKTLLDTCQDKKIPIICLHLGGESRRGELSDKIINLFLPQADLALVVRSGNKDELFTRICQTNNIPLILLERPSQAVDHFKEIFQLN